MKAGEPQTSSTLIDHRPDNPWWFQHVPTMLKEWAWSSELVWWKLDIFEITWNNCIETTKQFWWWNPRAALLWSPFLVVFSPPARWGLLDFMSVVSSSFRFSSSSSSSFSSSSSSFSSSSLSSRRPRPTAIRDPRRSLPDLNQDHPRPVFPAGPQPRPSTPSVPCRTSTASIHAKCSLPDLNREYPRQVFPAGPHVGRYGTKNVQKKVRKNVRKNVKRYARRYAK